MCKYEMDLTSIDEDTDRHDSVHRWTDGQTERWTGWNQYTPLSTSLKWGVWLGYQHCCVLAISEAYSNPDWHVDKTAVSATWWSSHVNCFTLACCISTYIVTMGWKCLSSLIARFMGPTWGQLGPPGPRWAPSWPHEPCYLGNSP